MCGDLQLSDCVMFDTGTTHTDINLFSGGTKGTDSVVAPGFWARWGMAFVFTKSGRNHRNLYVNIMIWKTELTRCTTATHYTSVCRRSSHWLMQKPVFLTNHLTVTSKSNNNYNSKPKQQQWKLLIYTKLTTYFRTPPMAIVSFTSLVTSSEA